jgi:hypothetical protein
MMASGANPTLERLRLACAEPGSGRGDDRLASAHSARI